MAKTKTRYRVVCDYIKYPADKEALKAIEKAGGIRYGTLTEKQKAKLNYKRANKGDFCDDMLPHHVAHYLKQGRIEEVQVPKVARKAAKGGK